MRRRFEGGGDVVEGDSEAVLRAVLAMRQSWLLPRTCAEVQFPLELKFWCDFVSLSLIKLKIGAGFAEVELGRSG